MKAIWNGQILAESNETIVVKNNHYFPMPCINRQFFTASYTKSFCQWKGEASYYSLLVKDEENIDAAWYYTSPKNAAIEIKDHVAFWRGVEVSE